MSNLIRLAIIDDGVNPSLFSMEQQLEYDVQISPDLVITARACKETLIENPLNRTFSHGTTCAAIIYKYTRCRFISSIKILNEHGKSTTHQLIKAIDWCIEHSINIINMSMGSIAAKDYDLLRSAVNRAYSHGIIIVAAQSNQRIVTYPASFSNVIGVNCDHTGRLHHQEFIFHPYPLDGIDVTANACHELEHCVTGKFHTQRSNSYAAPVITSIIYKLLENNPKLQIEEIRLNLCNLSSKNAIKSKTEFKYAVNYNPYFYLSLDWVKNAIVLFHGAGVFHHKSNLACKVKEVIYTDSFENESDLYAVLSDEEVDTVLIIDQMVSNSKASVNFISNNKLNLDFTSLTKYNKHIGYIGIRGGFACIQLGLRKTDFLQEKRLYSSTWNEYVQNHNMQNGLLGQPLLSDGSQSVAQTAVPIVFIYGLTLDALTINDVLSSLQQVFENEGYAVVATGDNPASALYHHSYITMSDRGENLSVQLSTLSMIYDPDIIIVGFYSNTFHNTETIFNVHQHFNSDLHIYMVNEGIQTITHLPEGHSNHGNIFYISEDEINGVDNSCLDKLYNLSVNFFQNNS